MHFSVGIELYSFIEWAVFSSVSDMLCVLCQFSVCFGLVCFFCRLLFWFRSLSKSYYCYYYRYIYIYCSAIMCLLVGPIFIFFIWWSLKLLSRFYLLISFAFSSSDYYLGLIIFNSIHHIVLDVTFWLIHFRLFFSYLDYYTSSMKKFSISIEYDHILCSEIFFTSKLTRYVKII